MTSIQNTGDSSIAEIEPLVPLRAPKATADGERGLRRSRRNRDALPGVGRVRGERDAAANDDGASAVRHDERARDAAPPNVMEYLRHAQKVSGRRPFELVREWMRLRRGPGKLTLREYVQYGVYDTERYGPEDQARFIAKYLHWPVAQACCDMTWQATTEDKWLCARLLANSAIKVPETLAVIDKGERAYPGTRKISTAAELRDFMTANGSLPLFGKENRGICSLGAFLAVAADSEGMELKGHGRVTYEAFLRDFVGSTAYLLQPAARNHGFFAGICDALATVRLCILVAGDEIKIPFAVLKLPSRDNVADSFWRPGNLACKLDVASGEILNVRSKDHLGTTDHSAHPDSGAPLRGETVPMWGRVLDLAHDCAPIFHPVRYQSMDIAVTDEGPVLVEINTGGGFDLPQLASGEGFLTDEVQAFFRSCGYTKI